MTNRQFAKFSSLPNLIDIRYIEKFNIKEQDGWVDLVGDGRTYQHLINIIQQYRLEINCFPRRLTYTEQLSACNNEGVLSRGLRELAMSCGFQSPWSPVAILKEHIVFTTNVGNTLYTYERIVKV